MADKSAQYLVTMFLNAEGNIGKKMRGFAKQVQATSSQIIRHNAAIVGSFTKMMAGIGAATAAYLGQDAVRSGLAFNAELEAMNNRVATTLRLFGHISPGVMEGASAAEQFAANIREGEAISRRLVTIANESPGGFQQVAGLFQDMLPGARAVEGNMERILKLTQQGTLVAGVLGGAFEETGRDFTRILQGGAGMEVKAWKLLQVPIAQAAKKFPEIEKKMKGLVAGTEDFVKTFNSGLTGAERFNLLMEATKSLGPEVAEVFANSWEGATSTAGSAVRQLFATATTDAFQAIKRNLVRVTTGEGFLATGSKRFKELTRAMEFVGEKIAKLFSGVALKLFQAGNYLADNWESVFAQIRDTWNRGFRLAKMFLLAKGVMTGGALAAGAGASAFRGAQGMFGAGKSLNNALAPVRDVVRLLMNFAGPMTTLASVFGIAVAAAGVFAGILLAIGGIIVAATSVLAFFIENWDQLVVAFRTGQITLDPLLNAVDHLWAKMVAAGGALTGTTSATDSAQGAINMLTEGVHWLTGGMGGLLRILAFIYDGFLGIKIAVKAVYLGFVTLIQGIVGLLKTVMGMIPGMESAALGGNVAFEAMEKHRRSIAGSMQEDMNAMAENRILKAALAFEAAFAKPGEGITKAIREQIDDSLGISKGGGNDIGTKARTKTDVNIHNMTVYNDLRNEDPDRVAGAFVKRIVEVTERPTQASTLEDFGI